RQVQSASSRCIRREPPSRFDCCIIKGRSLVVSSSAITQHRQLEVTNLVRCRGCPTALVDQLQPRQGEAMTTTQCLQYNALLYHLSRAIDMVDIHGHHARILVLAGSASFSSACR